MSRNLSQAQLDGLTEIYSLIISIDHTERAYLRDSISASDYGEISSRLLSQYAKLIADPKIESAFGNIDRFVTEYRITGDSGVERLKIGIPATAEALATIKPDTTNVSTVKLNNGSNSGTAKAIAEVAGHFITFCDGIHLGFRGKSDLHPLLTELATSLNRVTKTNFSGRGKIVEWLIKLNQLKIGQQLSEDEADQCLKDVEAGYQSFLALLD